KAAAAHVHGIADIDDLATALAGKADDPHGHGIDDVTGLTAALSGKAAAATHFDATYTPLFNITGLFKAEEPAMPALHHKLVDTKTGDDISLVFDIRDANGDAVDLTTAAITYKISRRAGDAALLTKTQDSGIARSGSIATVSFNTAEMTADDAPLIGDFFG